MIVVVIKPIFGTSKASIERAREELAEALSFRGDIIDAESNGSNIIVRFEINPGWNLPPQERVKFLKEYIPSNIRTTLRVLRVSEDNHN